MNALRCLSAWAFTARLILSRSLEIPEAPLQGTVVRGGEQLVTCRLSGLAEAGLPLTPSCQLPNIICRERPQNLSLQGPKEDPRPWALGQALRVEGEAMARLLVREAHLTAGTPTPSVLKSANCIPTAPRELSSKPAIRNPKLQTPKTLRPKPSSALKGGAPLAASPAGVQDFPWKSASRTTTFETFGGSRN